MVNQSATSNRKVEDILAALEFVRSHLDHCDDPRDRLGLDEEEELLTQELYLVAT